MSINCYNPDQPVITKKEISVPLIQNAENYHAQLLFAYQQEIEKEKKDNFEKEQLCLKKIIPELKKEPQQQFANTLLRTIDDKIAPLAKGAMISADFDKTEKFLEQFSFPEEKIDFFALFAANLWLKDLADSTKSDDEQLGDRAIKLQKAYFPNREKDFITKIIKIIAKYPNFDMPESLKKIDNELRINFLGHLSEYYSETFSSHNNIN